MIVSDASRRRPERPPPDTADYVYSLSRFSYDEIVELAMAVWGPCEPGRVLVPQPQRRRP